MRHRLCLPMFVFAPLALLGQGRPASTISVAADRPAARYEVGETVGWTVSVPADLAGGLRYTVRRNGLVPVAEGTIPAGATNARIETRGTEPAMLLLTLTAPGRTTNARLDFGAAVSPTRLRPVAPRPGDFDAFWDRKLAELRRVPENARVIPVSSPRPGVEYATIRMDHINGTGVYGQIARPSAKPGERSRKYPAILQLQWAGGPYALDPSWIVGRAAQGFLVLNIEPHNVLPTEPPEYYAALPPALKDYPKIGWESRETSGFVEMFLRGVRAVDYLAERPDWDGRTMIVMGTSMGGQQSLAVAALHPKVTHLIANEPAGCDLAGPLQGRAASYPFFPTENPRVMETARYVDGINFAPKIRARSLVAMGFVDDVTRPAGIWTAYNLVRGPKEAAPMPDSPHNHLATPEQQRPFTDRAEAWLAALARGEEVRPAGVPPVPSATSPGATSPGGAAPGAAGTPR